MTGLLTRRIHKAPAGIVALLISASMTLTGCMGDEGTGGVSISTATAPERVVMQIINNSCNDEQVQDSESLTTGDVKGLSKVMNGFGIPYDEHANEFQLSPQPITDDSYEANKNRGIGYAGLESHYPANIKSGEQHVEKTPGSYVDGQTLFNELTSDEEMYGCCMRWEYVGGSDYSGPGIDGYFNFLRGSEGNRQYIAIHGLNTDKWCICCPFDYGPAYNLPTTGGGQYANGRIGGVSPEVAEALGFGGHGECPEEAMTEWWWVENSSQVKCGPVDDLSQFESGSNKSSSGSSSKTGSSSQKATVTTSIISNVVGAGTDSGNTAVSIEPANPNSFVNAIHQEWIHGDMPKDKTKYLMMHDTESGTQGMSDGPECIINAWSGNHIAAHFIVGRDGRIFQCVPLGKIGHHAGWAGHSANEKFDVPEDGRDDMVGSQNGDEDYGMSSYCIGIEIEHEHNEGAYPEAQLNALDRLVAYIDQEIGHETTIIDHKEWASQPDSTNQKQDCSDDFPLDNYKKTRNHNGVATMGDAEEAKAKGACSDDEEEEEDSIGGEEIAAMAVKVAGVASPESHRDSGILCVEPTDSRWKDYVAEKKKVYGPTGDPAGIWASCCRMSIAVTASGADTDMPVGPCSAQWEYCSSSPKWQTVGQLRAGDRCDDVLKPGDFLVWNGPAGAAGAHTMVYVGNEAVKKKFPSSNANFVESHYDSGYPQASYQEYVHYGDFTIFRIKGSKKKKGSAYDGDEDALCYMQGDPRWASTMYQTPCDIGSHGCGCCATAHALTLLLNEEITPDVLARQMEEYANPKGLTYCMYGVGTVYAPWAETVQGVYDNIKIEMIDSSFGGVKTALEEGNMVVFGVGGAPVKTESGQGRYTNGHVMMAYKADGDIIWTKGSAEGGHISYNAQEFASIGLGCAFSVSLKDGSKVTSKKSNKKTDKTSKKSSKTVSVSRYMFVGDSRTNQMGGCLRESLSQDFMDGEITAAAKSPDGKDEFWIAKGSMGYPWFKDTAVPLIDQNVKSGDAIIIWMGVNGAPSYSAEYAELVNQKAKEWKEKGAVTYYASVGPENGELAARNGMGGSDAGVVQFNNDLKSKLSSDVGWIDVYAAIKDNYGSSDGVHYDQATYQRVYDCMVNGASGGTIEVEDDEGGSEGEDGERINVEVTRV